MDIISRNVYTHLATAQVFDGRFAQKKINKVSGFETSHKLGFTQPVVVVLLGAEKMLKKSNQKYIRLGFEV